MDLKGRLYECIKDGDLCTILTEAERESDLTLFVVYRSLKKSKMLVLPAINFYDPDRFKRIT